MATRDTRVLSDPEDEKTFETAYGAFTLRRPSIFLQREIHKEAARNLEGLQNVDVSGELLNLAMVTITVCARADNQRPQDDPRGFPQGFTWKKAYDIDFVSKLYSDFSEWVSSFRKPEGLDADKAGGAQPSKVEGVPTADEVRVGASQP